MSNTKPLGIMLVNLGTPDSPTVPAIKKYLAEFLSDPRVVKIPRLIWLPILYGFILPFRPKKLVAKYELIWGDTDAPIRHHSKELALRLEPALNAQTNRPVFVRSAMTYGNPSISATLTAFSELGVKDIMVIPMFPQYSASTTAAVLDKLNKALLKRTEIPAIRFITDYYSDPNYIAAIAASVLEEKITLDNDTKLIISFHGLPQAQVDAGDPYASHCEISAAAIAKSLNLNAEQWQLCYQSRFGPAPWLKPYTSEVLTQLPATGISKVIIVCPGFSVDCLETIEEIDQLNREIFMAAGGLTFTYVPALNASDKQTEAVLALVQSHLYVDDIKSS